MAQAMVNFRMDEALKERMEKTCKEMGLTVTAAYTMFATKVTREQRIPFVIKRDQPNASTMRALKELADMEKHPEKYKSYASADELFDEVFADEV